MTKENAWYRRLIVQMVALLTVALLPLGMIALYQTNQLAIEADRTASLALLGLTERAARSEQLLIERAVGMARLFGSIAPDLLDDPKTCAANLSRFIDANPEYSFIGVLPLSGIVECSSTSETLDFSSYPDFAETMAAQQPTIVINSEAPVSGQSVFIVSEPFAIDGEFAGFVSISIPHRNLPQQTDDLTMLGMQDLFTFNRAGVILTSRSPMEQAKTEIPADINLAGLSTSASQSFRAVNSEGVERRYSIVTIEGSPAVIMAVWRIGESGVNEAGFSVAPAIFPVLMWFASIGVAMLAVHTLVLRHLVRMRRNMDAFADNRKMFEPTDDMGLIPVEIAKLEENFRRMSEEVMRDEAMQENALREKDVLVKEIHHRVKNNLQLISSIMNMQIRSAAEDETRNVLRRVQDRVLSLATIHRDLYQSQDGGRVNVGTLISEIVEKSAELAMVDGRQLTVITDVENIWLYPDQAVPLSLLVAEATTNAMKYIGNPPQTPPSIEVILIQEGDTCLLKMTNSVHQAEGQESTGMGSKLMNAFAMQLGGQIDITQTSDHYILTLRFKALEFQPEARDY